MRESERHGQGDRRCDARRRSGLPRWLRAVALVAGLPVVLVGCGGDGASDTRPTANSSTPVATMTTSATTASTTTPATAMARPSQTASATSLSGSASPSVATGSPTVDTAEATATAVPAIDTIGDITTIEVNVQIIDLDMGAGGLWLASGDGQVTRIDPATNEIVASINAGTANDFQAVSVEVDGDAVWAAFEQDASLVRIDPATNTVVEAIELTYDGQPYPAVEIDVLDGSIWVVSRYVHKILQVDIASQTVVATIDVQAPVTLRASDTAIWVGASAFVNRNNTIVRIDPATAGVVAEIPFSQVPWDFAIKADDVLVAGGLLTAPDDGVGSLARIDPRTNDIETLLNLEFACTDVLVDGPVLWEVCGLEEASYLVRIDAETYVVDRLVSIPAIEAPTIVTRIFSDGSTLWLGTNATSVIRVELDIP